MSGRLGTISVMVMAATRVLDSSAPRKKPAATRTRRSTCCARGERGNNGVRGAGAEPDGCSVRSVELMGWMVGAVGPGTATPVRGRRIEMFAQSEENLVLHRSTGWQPVS